MLAMFRFVTPVSPVSEEEKEFVLNLPLTVFLTRLTRPMIVYASLVSMKDIFPLFTFSKLLVFFSVAPPPFTAKEWQYYLPEEVTKEFFHVSSLSSLTVSPSS